MGWERRGSGHYFYRSKWEDGRSIRRYIGRGAVGHLAELIDVQARQRRQSEAEAVRAETARFAAPEAALRALDAACDLMTAATLVAAGFHRPNYAWRRCRVRAERA